MYALLAAVSSLSLGEVAIIGLLVAVLVRLRKHR